MSIKVARGDMTPEERAEARRRQKYTNYLRAIGKGIFVYDWQPIQDHLLLLRKTMSVRSIAQASDVSETTINDLLRGSRYHQVQHPIKSVLRRHAEAILAVQPIPSDPLVDNVGARRRLRALAVAGWPNTFIAPQVDMTIKSTWRVANYGGHGKEMQRIRLSRHELIKQVYDKYIDQKPEDYGFKTQILTRTRTLANRHGWAPHHAWDDIDNDERPEWTGECGTIAGYDIHLRDDIGTIHYISSNGKPKRRVVCDACRAMATTNREATRARHDGPGS